MAAALTVTSRRADDGTVELAAYGELDMSTIGRFENALREALDESGSGRATTLDLSGVEYLDSSAINVLFDHADRIRSVLVHPLLLRGLTISGLDQVVEVRSAALD